MKPIIDTSLSIIGQEQRQPTDTPDNAHNATYSG